MAPVLPAPVDRGRELRGRVDEGDETCAGDRHDQVRSDERVPDRGVLHRDVRPVQVGQRRGVTHLDTHPESAAVGRRPEVRHGPHREALPHQPCRRPQLFDVHTARHGDVDGGARQQFRDGDGAERDLDLDRLVPAHPGAAVEGEFGDGFVAGRPERFGGAYLQLQEAQHRFDHGVVHAAVEHALDAHRRVLTRTAVRGTDRTEHTELPA